MSIFSGPVTRVANTRIFARTTDDNKQYLVLQMDYAADRDVALIVPLPTPADTAADAVRFTDLAHYPEFFIDLANGFPIARSAPMPGTVEDGSVVPLQRPPENNSSFVPSRAALSELGEDYRDAAAALEQLPEYHDYGFAVFKLPADTESMTPVAVEFPTRNAQLLFFPTLTLKEGHVETDSYFDIDLFAQAKAGWMRSYDSARSFMDLDRAKDVVDPNLRVERFTVLGIHPNSDIVLDLNT